MGGSGGQDDFSIKIHMYDWRTSICVNTIKENMTMQKCDFCKQRMCLSNQRHLFKNFNYIYLKQELFVCSSDIHICIRHLYINTELHLWIFLCAFISIETDPVDTSMTSMKNTAVKRCIDGTIDAKWKEQP